MKTNIIYNENCLDTMAAMPDNFVDLVVTSPPYADLRDYKGFTFDFERTAVNLLRILKVGGVIVWVVGDKSLDWDESGTSFRQALFFKDIGFKLVDTMIYTKPAANGARNNQHLYIQGFEYMFILSKSILSTVNLICDRPNKTAGQVFKPRKIRDKDGVLRNRKAKNMESQPYGRRSNIWYYLTGKNQSSKDAITSKHPAIFPEQLAADHIKSWSNEGDIVYDPFMGSGTTAKMALKAKRKFIGSEISKEYCEIAEKRLKPIKEQGSLIC